MDEVQPTPHIVQLNWESCSKFYFAGNYNRLNWLGKQYKNFVTSESFRLPWVMSFSRSCDSLSQWGMYTDRKHGGVAIGVSRKDLVRDIKHLSAEADSLGFELQLKTCLYSETNRDASEDMFDQENLMANFDLFNRIGEALSAADVSPDDLRHALMKIAEIAILVKDESFFQEQEVRLILHPRKPKFDDCSIIGCKPRWRTHIDRSRVLSVNSAQVHS